jgi:ubiquinone biosynthesis monooxygenase Coq7
MRVNHTGEVCAQALYHAQSLSSRNDSIRANMQQAAIEEGDHLAWCKARLDELGAHTSYLNPLWYASSFAIGVAAGMIGDAWNLGFLAETEKQVVEHLERQLKQLPFCDEKSYAILQQMQIDEQHHHDEAMLSGAKELPLLIKKLMHVTATLMVKTAYWV